MRYPTLTFLLFFGLVVKAQEFYDINTIHTIEITFSQSNWDQLLDEAYATTGDYIMAQRVTIDGVEYDSVGVKYKGNSSYNANQIKNPWHIELNTYKDQEYEGYTDLKLANVAKDPSFLRDVLGYKIVRQYMDAPLANYANLYVNGTLIGLYSNVESISKKFVNKRFGSKDNAFFDCSPPEGAGPQGGDYPNLVYLGQDSTAYYEAYGMKSEYGWQELIDLCDTLNNFTSEIEKILDVDRALWMLAFDNVIVNLDSYIGIFSQNYYLYRDDYGRFLPIVWDLNESFGVFSQTGTGNLNSTIAKQQMDPFLHENDLNYPLMQKLLNVPTYRRMYLAHYKTILEENFENGKYYEDALALQALIDGAVQADPNKFFTYTNFLSNLTTDVSSGGPGGPGGPGGASAPGITNLMDARTDYLLSLPSFSAVAPDIANITLSDATPIISDTIVVTAAVSNANSVFLACRTESGAPFFRIYMYDDGAHGDGVAADGIYGASLPIEKALTQYYIYAENDDIGKFSPQRAEHEFHTITATSSNPTLGDVVINEFMASNDATVADQDGEYDDWIELYNNSAEAIDLSGYFLSDDPGNLLKWELPAGTEIGAGGYLIVWADEDEDQAGLHASFKLSASGESVVLSDPSGNIIDEVAFADQMTDISYGRYPNGTGDFQTMYPTFNAENTVLSAADETNQTSGILTIFPNPAKNEVTIQSSETLEEILLYDLSGRLVWQNGAGQNNQQFDLNDVHSGIYIVKAITVNNEVLFQKLVVAK
jgi:hypothetical protein